MGWIAALLLCSQLALAAHDRVDRHGAFEMHGVDVVDHADLGSGPTAQLRDLARHVETHLEDGDFVFGA